MRSEMIGDIGKHPSRAPSLFLNRQGGLGSHNVFDLRPDPGFSCKIVGAPRNGRLQIAHFYSICRKLQKRLKSGKGKLVFWMTWLLFHFFWSPRKRLVYAICNFVMFVFFFHFFLIWLLLFISTPDVISTGHKGPMPVALLVHVTRALGFGPSSVSLSCVSSMSCRTTQYLDEEVAWNRGLRKLIETCEFFMIENPLELELCWVAFGFTVLSSNSSHTRGCLGISVQMREINIRKSLALRALEGSI